MREENYIKIWAINFIRAIENIVLKRVKTE